MEDLIRRSSIRNMYSCLNAEDRVRVSQVLIDIDAIPAFEPNLMLPERVERGEVYDVGETITVMNHEDYMEMFCKAMMWDAYGDKPRQGEWLDINVEVPKARCSNCNTWSSIRGDFCSCCGAKMK